jgi:ATP-binding cassette subfamily B protein
LNTWWFVWRLICYAPGVFMLQAALQIFYLGIRVVPGLLEKAIFDAITAAAPAGLGGAPAAGDLAGMAVPAVAMLIVLYLSVGLARMVATYGESFAGYTFRLVTGAQLRHNLMAARLRQPGAAAPPLPAGEALNRYRTDVAEVCDFPLWLPDVAGNLLSFVIAVVIMASINWVITIFVFLPVSVAYVVGRLAWDRYLAYGHAAGRAEDAATGFLGDILAAVQAIKVAGAEESVTAHFAALSRERSQAVVRLRMLENSLGAIYQVAVTAGIGVMLLLAGQAMAGGSFTVGDFALFTYYLWFTADLPGYLGSFVGDIKQQEVAIERLVELIPHEAPEALLDSPSAAPACQRVVVGDVARITPADARLVELRVDGLTCLYAGTSHGVRNIDLALPAGSFTVITGQIGAGKTTLLRALLGLLPRSAGVVTWNGEEIADLAAWFQPPRCAFTPQTPRLFSTTLADNILLGLAPGPGGSPDDRLEEPLRRALWQAVLEPDVVQLAQGLETLVGPRGVRLSGGQVQRVGRRAHAAAHPRNCWSATTSPRRFGRGDRAAAVVSGWRARKADGQRSATLLVVSHRPPGAASARTRSSCSRMARWRQSARSTHCCRPRRRCSGCGLGRSNRPRIWRIRRIHADSLILSAIIRRIRQIRGLLSNLYPSACSRLFAAARSNASGL